MAITEEHRHRLYTKLEEVLGSEDANTLMAHLPPVGWADVATKHDLAQLEAATKRDLERVEISLSSRIERVEISLSSRIERVETSLGSRIDRLEGSMRELDTSLRGEMVQLEHRLGEKLHRELYRATHAFVGWMLVANLGMAGTVLAAVKLT